MDERALIFKNLLNGVPMPEVCACFKKSEEEVNRIFSHVLRKIKSYCYERSRQKKALPVILAHDLNTAKQYRVTCLSVLPNLNLDKEPLYKDIQYETLTQDNILSVTKNLGT